MGSFSILPESLSFIETWLVRFFLLLALLVAGPWILALVYDFLLYVWRCATYDIPYIGGRARGRRRPRVPSLTARPDGHRRQISLPGILKTQSSDAPEGSTTSALDPESFELVERPQAHVPVQD